MSMLIEIPEFCPACNSKLVLINEQLFCKGTNCSVVGAKQIEHYAKTLSIKGLGPKTIEKLEITHISEIYLLSVETLANKLGSIKLATKLFAQIQKSSNATVDKCIAALGIPLVGTVIGRKLAEIVDSILDITEEVCTQAKLGNKATDNLLNFLNGDIFQEAKGVIPLGQGRGNVDLTVLNVVITGKLHSFPNKAAAIEEIEKLEGYTVIDSVTKETDILIDETEGGSAKRIKAENYGIKIVTDLNKWLKNNI